MRICYLSGTRFVKVRTFPEYLHFSIHNSSFFDPISLRIPNNSVNFVVRLQTKDKAKD